MGWLDGIRGNFLGQPALQQNIERRVYQPTLWREDTYTYDTLGNPAFPEAPYAMTDPTAVGPMIGDTPTSIERALQQGVSSIRKQSERCLRCIQAGAAVPGLMFQMPSRLVYQSTVGNKLIWRIRQIRRHTG